MEVGFRIFTAAHPAACTPSQGDAKWARGSRDCASPLRNTRYVHGAGQLMANIYDALCHFVQSESHDESHEPRNTKRVLKVRFSNASAVAFPPASKASRGAK